MPGCVITAPLKFQTSGCSILENAPREAQVKEHKRVAEPIGVAALVRNRGEVVRRQGVVTGDPMLVGGRLQVARPQLVA